MSSQIALAGVLAGVLLLAACASPPAASPDPASIRRHSDASIQTLRPQPSEDQSLTATGHGDLSKGPLICQRVADTAARAELAKLIRVTIKEHAIDRVRERTGQPVEQDIEVVREELVNELLRDVQIVDRRVDRSAGTCSSTAVMTKARILPGGITAPPPGPRCPSVVRLTLFYIHSKAVIPAKAGIQIRKTGFRVKPGMTIKRQVTSDALHWRSVLSVDRG